LEIIKSNYFKKYDKISIDEFIDNNSLIGDYKRIADNFNAFFANVYRYKSSSKNTCIQSKLQGIS